MSHASQDFPAFQQLKGLPLLISAEGLSPVSWWCVTAPRGEWLRRGRHSETEKGPCSLSPSSLTGWLHWLRCQWQWKSCQEGCSFCAIATGQLTHYRTLSTFHIKTLACCLLWGLGRGGVPLNIIYTQWMCWGRMIPPSHQILTCHRMPMEGIGDSFRRTEYKPTYCLPLGNGSPPLRGPRSQRIALRLAARVQRMKWSPVHQG